MKKIMMGTVVLSVLIGLVSTVQAHPDWTKNFWEQQERQSGGSNE